MSSGLMIVHENENDLVQQLKETSDNTYNIALKSLSTQQTETTLSDSLAVKKDNVYLNQLKRAKLELEEENWEQAERIYNKILDEDVNHLEANLGMFMTKYRINDKKNIPYTAWSVKNEDVFQSVYFQRALKYADSVFESELFEYIIGKKYLQAQEIYQRCKEPEDFRKASLLFEALGEFADSDKMKIECTEKFMEGYYQKSIREIHKIKTEQDCKKIIRYLEKIIGYKDVDVLKSDLIIVQNYLLNISSLENSYYELPDVKKISDDIQYYKEKINDINKENDFSNLFNTKGGLIFMIIGILAFLSVHYFTFSDSFLYNLIIGILVIVEFFLFSSILCTFSDSLILFFLGGIGFSFISFKGFDVIINSLNLDYKKIMLIGFLSITISILIFIDNFCSSKKHDILKHKIIKYKENIHYEYKKFESIIESECDKIFNSAQSIEDRTIKNILEDKKSITKRLLKDFEQKQGVK